MNYTLDINAEAATIYKALATKNGIQNWWCKNTNAEDNATVGGIIEMEFDKEGTLVPMHMKVEGLTENKKVDWSCFHNGNPAWIDTTLSFEINEKDGGSQLVFNHDNWKDEWIDTPPYKMTQDGWNYFVNSLKEYCETGKGGAW